MGEINEGIRVKEIKKCYLCGSPGKIIYSNLRDRLFKAKGLWNFMECPKCSLVWLYPRPISDNTEKLYEGYFSHNASTILENHKKFFTTFLEFITYGSLAEIISFFDLFRKRWRKGGGKKPMRIGKRLLDLGCGNGEFLYIMQNLGWEVQGVEPDLEAVKKAKKLALKVYNKRLEEVKFPKNFFDLITLNFVIEHLDSPLKVLKECRRILKDSGRIIVTTPNTESLGRKIFGLFWLHWDPPRHIFLFSPQTIRSLFKKAGLKILKLKTRSIWALPTHYYSRKFKQGIVQPRIRSFKSFGFSDYIFAVREYLAMKINKELGEEIVLICGK